jgi:hemoglobin-like flavoprotein
MFTTHPELLDGTFNRDNQAQGNQQLALAGSVAAFATALVKTPGHLLRSALIERGVPPRDIQYEVFGPDLWEADYD